MLSQLFGVGYREETRNLSWGICSCRNFAISSASRLAAAAWSPRALEVIDIVCVVNAAISTALCWRIDSNSCRFVGKWVVVLVTSVDSERW
jgi:hypothetical protein